MEETTTQAYSAIKAEITYDDYLKLDIRICEIITLEKVEKTDKLYKAEINTGVDTRIVICGIAQEFAIDQLLGKKFPFILNLPPREMKKIVSTAMIILSADKDNKLYAIGDENAPVGSIII